MDPNLLNNIRKLLDTTAVKKQLSEYFDSKETPIDSLVYPPILQDIGESIPDIASRIELSPFVEELDPRTGMVKVGWNLFVMGTERKFLGYTVHEDLNDINSPYDSPEALRTSLRYATPNEIIKFVIDTISKYEDHVTLGPVKFPAPQALTAKLPVANTYYEKNKSIGKS
jgi:hypothetical protein